MISILTSPPIFFHPLGILSNCDRIPAAWEDWVWWGQRSCSKWPGGTYVWRVHRTEQHLPVSQWRPPWHQQLCECSMSNVRTAVFFPMSSFDSLIHRLPSSGTRICVRGESLVAFLRKHDVIKIGRNRKQNDIVSQWWPPWHQQYCERSMSNVAASGLLHYVHLKCAKWSRKRWDINKCLQG